MSLDNIYKKLLKTFGKQGWWPVTLEDELHPQYHNKKKLTEKQKFEIIIGAILTQNTNWKNVEKAIVNLNKENILDINNILKTRKEKLADLIRPSGYFNQKADRLKIIARFFSKNKIKDIEKLPLEKLRKQLLDIKGIGPETADSILLYAFQKPVFVIDAYTKRIFSRYGLIDKKNDYNEFQKYFHKNLKKDVNLFNEYHALIVELAKIHCKTTPICKDCPLNKGCKKLIC